MTDRRPGERPALPLAARLPPRVVFLNQTYYLGERETHGAAPRKELSKEERAKSERFRPTWKVYHRMRDATPVSSLQRTANMTIGSMLRMLYVPTCPMHPREPDGSDALCIRSRHQQGIRAQ